ncbi:MAG: hypothetical protein GY706_10240, partial [Bacteroides sp.]|nr:hypothetical protein [Bacteroides sp.]
MGKEEYRYTNTYNEQGQLATKTDGKAKTTFTYNADGKIATQTGEEHSYDEQGNLAETKYLTTAGKHDFSRTFERTYDDAGRKTMEKKWEKYTDGTEPLLVYHEEYKYDDQGRMEEEKSLKENG